MCLVSKSPPYAALSGESCVVQTEGSQLHFAFGHFHESLSPFHSCVMLSASSYRAWLMLLLHHAQASADPHQPAPEPAFVSVTFTGSGGEGVEEGGSFELISRWDFHNFIMIQMKRTRGILVYLRVCRERGGFVFVGYVLICLYGRGAGCLPRWSSGFSSAWWTSSGPASPSASPRWAAAPPGSRLEDREKEEETDTMIWRENTQHPICFVPFLSFCLFNSGSLYKARASGRV